MKKLFIPLTSIFSIIATVLMVLGNILRIAHINFFGVSPHNWYYSATNFILFAILFHFAGTRYESMKKP